MLKNDEEISKKLKKFGEEDGEKMRENLERKDGKMGSYKRKWNYHLNKTI